MFFLQQLDFDGVEVRTQAEQKRIREENERKEMFRLQRLNNTLDEMTGRYLNKYSSLFPQRKREICG